MATLSSRRENLDIDLSEGVASLPDRFITTQAIHMDMGDLKQASTGGLSFRDIHERDKFYVDKSMLIADILETDDSGVYLYTRPRRFGKSTNISMLDAFFNLEYRGNDWFDGLEISDHHEYDVYKNSFPVVQIDLKDVVADRYDSFVARFRNTIRRTFSSFRYLLDADDVHDDEKDEIRAVLNKTISEDDMCFCINDLCSMLRRHHGMNVVVLIDEYDRAITDTFGSDLQGHIIGFMSSFMSSTLKGNTCLQMAYITGVMQVAKAGMFSGMNNLIVDDLFSKRSDERFGFTEKEVESILEYYEHPEKIDEVREWYDGYRFGDAEVYNPFSLMSYVSSGFEPLGYWSSSGNDMPIRWMMDRTDKRSVDTVADIISGIPTVSDMHVDLTYADMRRSRGTDLYSLMVMTGYLKAVPREDGRFDISIPNKEVRRMVDRVLKDVVPVDDSLFRDFAVAAMDGDAASMEELLGRLLEGSSYFDLKDESDYKLALFLCLHGIIWHYDVGCEMDRGNGRLDIIMRPRDGSVRPTIMELKISDRESSLEADAEGGIRQIHERKYYNRMRGEVLLYGISFWGVIPKVVVERIVL